ncbi:type II secretion system protein GspL [Sphingomonas canadensis]|uniref:Type II secretion system protein GspL n=1 Tax=Sphingomonas canadensis TaxID=1219257 RepID=A0ABW3H4L9_9SPHN|nr:type II secretion system protein GspL [Sphingomonas canadensis]MCW3835746.1 type II secretion system protein GspL [Sphingomonas canadensis]
MGARDSRASGLWSASAGGVIIAAGPGPAIALVPSEQVTLLSVELPLKSAAKRIAALPFAIEERIAEPLESVHLALGAPLGGDRYLAGVVRHEVMRGWIAGLEAAGAGEAALVPDALLMPPASGGGWNVRLAAGRATVMRDDGTGFACPESLLRTAWEAAGRPRINAMGDRLPDDMQTAFNPFDPGPEHLALAAITLDLRQGAYAARRPVSSIGRRVAWVAGIGLAAHAAILVADTIALGVIADRREAETRTLAALAAPGAPLGDDLAASVAAMLPRGGGAGGAQQTFLPLADRVFAAMAPLGPVSLSAMQFADNRLTLDFAAPAPADLAARLRAAFASAGVKAEVAETGGAVRVTAAGA